MKAMTGCVVWIVLIGLGLVIVSFTGCAPVPVAADPWSPWYNIPKPTVCGPNCQQWLEPGMMVKP